MEDVIRLAVILLFILGIIALEVWSTQLKKRRRLEARKMIHEERMKAMEKEIPLTELGHEVEETPDVIEVTTGTPAGRLLGVRLAALCLGLFMVFSGVGMVGGFALVEDLRDRFGLGFIPMMTGVGLLLFHYLTRDVAAQAGGERS